MTFPLLSTIGGAALIGVGAFTSEFGFGVPLMYAGGALIGGGAIASGVESFGSSAGTSVGNSTSTLLMIAVVGVIAYLILRKRGTI
jgi:hypothetical protein